MAFERNVILTLFMQKVQSQPNFQSLQRPVSIILSYQGLLPNNRNRFHRIPFICLRGGGDQILILDAMTSLMLSSQKVHNAWEKFRKSISGTLPQRFAQILGCFAIRTKYTILKFKAILPGGKIALKQSKANNQFPENAAEICRIPFFLFLYEISICDTFVSSSKFTKQSSISS